MRLTESQWALLCHLKGNPDGFVLKRPCDMREGLWEQLKEVESLGLIQLSRALVGPLRMDSGQKWVKITDDGLAALGDGEL